MAEAELDRVEDDSTYRLEVVPPEGESVDDVPAVSEAEIDDANSRLAELEDQVYSEGLENDELYRQIEDIRDAIEARDMAGMAVANEELATLESRLREAAKLFAPEDRRLKLRPWRSGDAIGNNKAVDRNRRIFPRAEDELGYQIAVWLRAMKRWTPPLKLPQMISIA